MYNQNDNQTVTDSKGKVLYFGYKDFIAKIVKGNCCFICGADPSTKTFNNEHVIPNWILKRYELHSEQINLPNNQGLKYGNYTVPCCLECNSELSKVYEKPISELFAKSYPEVIKLITNKGSSNFNLLFRWLNLIFIKTHLKDTLLRKSLDTRIDAGFIGDDFFWNDMHHIHCIARSHYSGAVLDDNVYGTVFIFPCILKGEDKKLHFDYIDNEAGKGILLQLGQFTVISILNDACAGYSRYISRFKKINGPLTEFQARQVFADLLFINLHLQERPVFKSEFREYGYVITAKIPATVTVMDKDNQGPTEGGLLRFYVDKLLNKEIENREQILQEIAERKRNYLWNDKDEFINYNK